MKTIMSEQLSQIEKRLEQRFDSFFNTDDRKEFFLGLTEYLQYTEQNPLLFKILEVGIKAERLKDQKKFLKLQEKVNKEIIKVSEKIFSFIEKKKIKSKILLKEIQGFEGIVDGRIQSTNIKEIDLFNGLEAIIRVLNEEGYNEISKKFIKFDETGKNILKYKIAPSYDDFWAEKSWLDKLRDRSVWGAWERLVIAYRAVLKSKDELDKAFKTKQWIRLLSYDSCFGEMDELLDRKPNAREYYFPLKDYKAYFNIVHNYLLDKLDKLKQTLPERKESNFSYDSEGAMLFYKDKLILKMHKNSGRAKIFKVLWKSKKIVINDKVIEKGNPSLLRRNLCKISGYSSNENIDKAINFFRKKLKDLPAEIVAEKGFRLIIKD